MKRITSFNPYVSEADMNGEVPILDKDYDTIGQDYMTVGYAGSRTNIFV